MNRQDALEKEIISFIRATNDAWTKEKGERLREYFHERMVAITPVDRLCRLGASECIAGWQGFASSATIHFWKDRDFNVQVFGEKSDTAVVTYYYDMEVTMGGSRFPLSGRDMMVLHREAGRWWIIADQFSSFPN